MWAECMVLQVGTTSGCMGIVWGPRRRKAVLSMPDVLDSFLFAESNCAILGLETTPPFYMIKLWGVRTPFTYGETEAQNYCIICSGHYTLHHSDPLWPLHQLTSGPLNRVSPRPAVANKMQWKRCKIVRLGVSHTGV